MRLKHELSSILLVALFSGVSSLGLVGHSLSLAGQYSFVNIVDTSMQAPVGSWGFFSLPSISNGRATFEVSLGSSVDAVLQGDGGPVAILAKTGDLAPGSASQTSFRVFGFRTSSSAERVLIQSAISPGVPRAGLFLVSGGSITPVVLANAIGANLSNSPTFGEEAAIEGDRVAFVDNPLGGVYLADNGALSKVAKSGDEAPETNGAKFFSFGRGVSTHRGVVAFRGLYGASQDGVFASDGVSLRAIALQGDPAPSGTFDDFFWPSVSAGRTAFYANFDSTRQGIFVEEGGNIVSVAMTGDSLLGGVLTSLYQMVSVGGSQIVFNGTVDGALNGLFVHEGASLTPVLKTGDPLFGSTVVGAQIGRFGLDPADSGQIAFSYALSDGRRGIAIATPVPEPRTLGALLGLMFYTAASMRTGGLRKGR